MRCHPTIRALNGGACPMCDVAPPPDVIAELEAEESAARDELRALDRDAALTSLAEFVRQGWTVLEGVDLEWNWHHDALCSNVQGMLEEWIQARADKKALKKWRQRWQRMVINICPGTLKSRIVMVFAVAWMWLRCPSWQVLCVSNTPDNVWRDAGACRDLVTSAWYRSTFTPSWDIVGGAGAALTEYHTTERGKRLSKGMGGTFTGFHVDAIFMDDPDDAHGVHSEIERKSRKSKIASLSTRFNDKRCMIWLIMQQRVHVDDASADMIASPGTIHASYPLGTRAFDPCTTPFFVDPRSGKAGELIHDERFTADVIAAAIADLGTAGFEAQYEQDPGAAGGNLVKLEWFRYFTIEGRRIGPIQRPKGADVSPAHVLGWTRAGKLELDYMDVSVDASFGSTTDTASEVAIQVHGGRGVKRYMFEDDTKVRTFLETVAAVASIITKWQPFFAGVISVLVEKKANGAAVIETLALNFQGLIPIEPDGGKGSRAAAMSPLIESGCLYLLEGEEWLQPFLTGSASVTVFPNGKKDDRMDALSQEMNHRRQDLDAMRLAAKSAALLALRQRTMHQAGA